MASVLKAQSANAKRAGSKRKRNDAVSDAADDTVENTTEPKRRKNKQRVLLLSSRGVTHRMRHLMADLEVLLPHVKKGKHRCEPSSVE